jgi:uncharacterized damage-inducible protein DinB
MDPLRDQLSRLLAWHEAHVDFDAAVAGVPEQLRGQTPPGAPHSPWQLLEHIRITQHDIRDFCLNPAYQEMTWPDDYWPADAAPASAAAWDDSIAAVRRDRMALQALAVNPSTDLFATIPHGTGQTFLREILLVADHSAYHVGQLVLVRRLLGNWPQE